ncbi:hypothetical protein LCGC14_2244590 [marine sediment metagenome]|uniref:Lon proteolytic domain-containing protein n=1 Tax=marine sediment metagenome TaxID=412755 RepID=A0A0F9DS10_9ZZZZ
MAFDLSKVFFITTANLQDPIPAPLRDRMEVIELSGYTEHEKLEIAKRYLLPRQLTENGIPEGLLTITDDAILDITRSYTHEAGVRNLERELGAICRSIARRVTKGESEPLTVGEDDLPDFLGPPRFRWELAEGKDEVGVATGLAATMAGGDILFVEATAALTYARSRASALDVQPSFFDKHDIHIHVPAGAIPKDGPSAGVTIATALVSAITKRPARKDVAMTGEITLRGKVLPVGSVRDKVLAAHRAGLKRVVLPDENEKDLAEVSEEVRAELEFVLVDHVDEVLNAVLHPEKRQEQPKLVAAAH